MSSTVTIGNGNGFSLGDASNYALIAFNPHNFQGTADSPIHGWVGVGAYSGIQLANDTIYGNLVTTGAAPSHTGGTVTGSIYGGNAKLAADISGLQALSQAAAHEAGTSLTLHNGQTVQVSCGTWDCHGNLVFNATNWADNVTLNGNSWETVIINVPQGAHFKLDNLHLTGGLTADHVLINYLGTDELHGVNKDTFEGTVLVPNAKVNVDGVTLDGHLYGGAAGQDFQWVSNATVNIPSYDVPCSTHSISADLHSLAVEHEATAHLMSRPFDFDHFL
ncbi:MAG TPA: collagen-binding domain-containing protein [Rhizomicrobium sp.]|nr:collagen-binding domain-containing protein [Rhizomicrobium sp.]